MKCPLILLVLAVFLFCALSAGCTSPTGPGSNRDTDNCFPAAPDNVHFNGNGHIYSLRRRNSSR